MRVVSLVSGGIDSIVMAKILQRQGFDQLPLFVDYGQRTLDREWEACQAMCADIGLTPPLRIDLSGFGKVIPSGLTGPEGDYRASAFVPGRNLMFLVVAAGVGHARKIDTIAIGLLSSGPQSFPDQTEDFVLNANFALNSALGASIKILTPVNAYSKRQVIELAVELKLPLSKTYSCHSGEQQYCGKCVPCREIIDSELTHLFPRLKGRSK